MDFEAIVSAGWTTRAGPAQRTGGAGYRPVGTRRRGAGVDSLAGLRREPTRRSRGMEAPTEMLAFTFPGQGAQRPGMGRPWAEHESWELVEEASHVADRDVARLLLDADADELRDTRNAQLVTFVLSLVVLDAIERLGVEPV